MVKLTGKLVKFATLKPNILVALPVFHSIARIKVPLNFATFRPSASLGTRRTIFGCGFKEI